MKILNIKTRKVHLIKKRTSQKKKHFRIKSSLHTFLLLFLLIYGQKGMCQAANYDFKATSETYTSITGISLPLSGGNLDNGWSNGNAIGFTFIFNGVNYTTFNASTNGFITFSGPLVNSLSKNTSSGGLTSGTKRPIIAPLWDDIYPGSLTFVTKGNKPNRITTIQWDNVLWDKTNPNGATVAFQLKLYETSNTIVFVYNNLAAAYHSGSGGASVGIAGATSGDYLSANKLSASATVSSSMETSAISTKPSGGLTFTFNPHAVGKNWIGSGAGGTGTDFNDPANWSPAGKPLIGEDLIMNINNFAASATPFATLSNATTINSLSVTFTGTGITQRTFNFNTGTNNFTIDGNLLLTNTSTGNGGGNSTTPGHSFYFNVGGGVTTIGNIAGDLTIRNTGGGAYFLTNIKVASAASLIDNGNYMPLINNNKGHVCYISLNNSGIVTINGTTTANALSNNGQVLFNVDNSGITNFNGNAIFDDGSSISTGIISLSAAAAGGDGSMVFRGNTTFGPIAASANGNSFGHTVFDATTNQAININTTSQLYLPPVTVGNMNSPTVTMNGNTNAQIGANSILHAPDNVALEIKNSAVLDLHDKTLNVSGGPALGKLTMAAGTKLRCGGTNGGLGGGSNFPANFLTYVLNNASTVEYYSSSNQRIADNITYGKLALSGSSTKTISGPSTIANGIISITPAATVLNLNNYTITANKAFSGAGVIKANVYNDSNPQSGIIAKGTGTIKFADTSHNYLKTLTINAGGNITLGNPVNMAADAAGGNYGTVTVNETGILNSNGNLTLKSSAGVDARIEKSAGTITGNVTVERFIPARRSWRLLTVPFSSSTESINAAWQEGQTITDPYACPTNDPAPAGYGTEITNDNTSLTGYDKNITVNSSLKVWQNNAFIIPATTTNTHMTDFSTYFIFVRGDRTICLKDGVNATPNNTVLRAVGVLNQTGGINSVSKSFTGNAGDYFYTGNPYASAIDLTNVINGSRSAANYGFAPNTFLVWDPKLYGSSGVGAYVTWSAGGIWAPTSDAYTGSYPAGSENPPVIQSGQAFTVQINTATGSNIQFQEDDKTTNEMNVFGKQQNAPKQTFPVIYTNLLSKDDTSLIDGVAAGFANKFSAAVDANDAQKLFSDSGSNISLYRSGKDLAIELRPIPLENDTLFFKLSTTPGSYGLQIFSRDIPENLSIDGLLIDRYLKTTTAVHLNKEFLYRFVAQPDTNSYKHRFMLILNQKEYSNSLNTQHLNTSDNLHKENIDVYSNPVRNNEFTLNLGGMQPGKYKAVLYNAQGESLIEKDIYYQGGSENYQIKLNQKCANGIYILVIENKATELTHTLKVVIDK